MAEIFRLDIEQASLLTPDQIAVVEAYANNGLEPEWAKVWVDRIGPAAAYCYAQSALRLHFPAERNHVTRLKLADQLAFFRLRHETMHLEFVGKRFRGRTADFDKKELAIADLLSNGGTLASHDEGICFEFLIKALAGNVMAELLEDVGRGHPFHQWTYAFFSIMRPLFLNAAPSSLPATQRDACIQRLSEAMRQPVTSSEHLLQHARPLQDAHPAMFDEYRARAGFAASLHNALPDGFWPNYIRICFEIGSQYEGWPDITVIEGAAVRFIEVKYHDKLRASQIAWLSNVAEPLNLNVSIVIARPA